MSIGKIAVIVGAVAGLVTAITPGIIAFIDNTDDRALAAIESAYPVLVNEVDHQRENLARQREMNMLFYQEIREIRHRMDGVVDKISFLGKPLGSEMKEVLDPETSSMPMVPPLLLIPATSDEGSKADEDDEVILPIPVRVDLDGLIQQQQQISGRDKLPAFDDLAREKK